MMPLTDMTRGRAALVTRVAWDALPPHEAHRLRMLGVDAGSEVEVLHRGVFLWRDPIAVRVGRMTVAMRRTHARAISVVPVDSPVHVDGIPPVPAE